MIHRSPLRFYGARMSSETRESAAHGRIMTNCVVLIIFTCCLMACLLVIIIIHQCFSSRAMPSWTIFFDAFLSDFHHRHLRLFCDITILLIYHRVHKSSYFKKERERDLFANFCCCCCLQLSLACCFYNIYETAASFSRIRMGDFHLLCAIISCTREDESSNSRSWWWFCVCMDPNLWVRNFLLKFQNFTCTW